MSDITNIMLTFSCLEDDGKFEKSMIDYFKATDGPKERLVKFDSNTLPCYAFEAYLYVGTFNYMNKDAFMLFLIDYQWRNRESVQVFIQTQESSMFSEMTLGLYGYYTKLNDL